MVNINAQQYLDEKFPKEKRNEIKELDIGRKNLESELDLSDFTNLEKLDCSSNYYLTSLQLSNNPKLKSIKCDWNKLSKLEINNCLELEGLNCSHNELTELDLNGHFNLQSLDCSQNKLKELDLQGLTKLQTLYCQENQLTNLNVDKLVELEVLNCRENPISQQAFKKLKTSVVKNCPNLEKRNSQLTDNAQEYLDWIFPKEERGDITWIYDELNNKRLKGSLKIEGFTKLEKLELYNNQITGLEVIGSPNLWKVRCQGNKLTKLNFNKLNKIIHLECESNQLTEIDVSGCHDLCTLSCENNLLTSLDLSQNWNLWGLWIKNNKFVKQDLSFLSHLFNLTSLKLDNNNFIGSLKPLQAMVKLELLSVRDTDIDSGLEYLSESVKEFDCSAYKETEAKIKSLEQELRKYGEPGKAEDSIYYRNFRHMCVSDNFFNLHKKWREVNSEKTEIAHQETLQELVKLKKARLSQKEKELTDFEKEATKEVVQLRSKGKKIGGLLKEQENERKRLKNKITELKREVTEVIKLRKELSAKRQQAQIEQPPK